MPRFLTFSAWASFVLNVIIIGTGGAVRLTGSGLGCSQWPLCTPDSLVPTAELGIHGIIEFGNRTLTGFLSVAAISVLFAVLSHLGGWPAVRNALGYAAYGVVAGAVFMTTAILVGLPGFIFFTATLLTVVGAAGVRSLSVVGKRKDLVSMAWIVLFGVILQAFVGGVTVLTELNPFIVGFHYIVSIALVCVTTAFIVRMYQPAGARARQVPRGFAILTHVTTLALTISVLMGVLTTANGPHSGDADVIRNGFDATLLSHFHSWPGYLTFALVIVLVVWSSLKRLAPRNWTIALLAALIVQIAVGVFQSRNGLPPLAVGVHMVLATLTASAMTVTVLRLKRPAA